MKAGIIGATGYAGQQLVCLLAQHPYVQIEFLVSNSYVGEAYSDIYRNFRQRVDMKCISIEEADEQIANIDVLFIALPHGKSMDIVPKCLKVGVKVIDFGADYRLKSPSTYESWYGLKHTSPETIKTAVYGLPELHKEAIKKAQLVANPGCYPTASILGLAPLSHHGLIQGNSVIIDAKSGVSGAGRSLKTATLYGESNESIKAYGVATHRHTPEIAQELSFLNEHDISVLFTPHLVPMNRGILATSYAKLNKTVTKEEIASIYEAFYKDQPFIRLSEDLPETRWVKNTNYCDISFRIDAATNTIIVVSAIDNLMKGAASQAVHNMNLMCGLNENTGLELITYLP